MAYASNPGNFLLRLSDLGAAGTPSGPSAAGKGNSMLGMIE